MIKLALAFIGIIAIAAFGWHITISPQALARHRAWAMRWRIWLRLRPADGYATFTELWFRWGRLAAVLDHGPRARPGMPLFLRLRSRATDYAVRYGRAQYGRRAYGRMQDQTLIIAPPQSGKSGLLADRILDFPGAVVSTSTRIDLFTNTAGERARRGPVHTFNPLGIGGIVSTFAWDILAGCDNPGTAIRRAQDLTGDHEVSGDLSWWQRKASAALAAMLHAAALDPACNMMTVYEWANQFGDKRAEKILDEHPRASRQFLATIGEIRNGGKTADSVRATITEALTWCAIPELAVAVCPPPGVSFDVGHFIATNGTLYLIAPGTETAPIAPLVSALVQHIHYEAGQIGSRTPAGKLDPGLFLALDELTQIVPIPMPAILADSAGKGIYVAAVVHSIGQLEQRWGRFGAETIWACSGTKIMLGGITDASTLEQVTRLTGTTRSQDGPVQVVPAELLRMLPRWRALILTGSQRPTVVKTRPVWHRRNRWFWRSPVVPPVLTPAPRPLHLAELPDTATQPASNGNGHHVPA